MRLDLLGAGEAGVVATSTVPAVRFVRVRQAGTERRFVVLDARTRERYVELVARSADADRGAAVAFGDGQPGRSVERASARARAAAVAARAPAVRRAARGSRGPAPDGRVRRRPALLRVDVAVDRRRRARSGAGIPTACEVEGFLAGLERVGVEGLPGRPGRVGGPRQRRPARRWTERCGTPGSSTCDGWTTSSCPAADTPAALSVFRAALATIGLRPNEAKTRILVDARGLGSTATLSGGP